jgi:hypothetical protein
MSTVVPISSTFGILPDNKGILPDKVIKAWVGDNNNIDKNDAKKKSSFYNKIDHYKKKISNVLFKVHKGKVKTFITICIIICVLIYFGYHIDGSYIDNKDEPILNPVVDRYMTLILYTLCYLLTGILGIIIGMESYKTFLEKEKARSLKTMFEELKKSKKFQSNINKQNIADDTQYIDNELNNVINEVDPDREKRLNMLDRLETAVKKLEKIMKLNTTDEKNL